MARKSTALEDKFALAWERYGMGGLPPEREFSVDEPPFDYPFDFAWPSQKILVEIDGHGYGHTLPKYRERDATKTRYAMVLGYTVLRFTSGCLSNEEKREDAINTVLFFMGESDEAKRRGGFFDHYGNVGRVDLDSDEVAG